MFLGKKNCGTLIKSETVNINPIACKLEQLEREKVE